MNTSSGSFGELFAVLAAVSWAISMFPFTEATRRLSPNTVNHFRLLMAFVILTFVLLIFSSMSFVEFFTIPNFENFLWLGLSGVIGLALADYFFFNMLAILGVKLGSLFSTLSPGAALLFSYLLLGEKISWIGFSGIIITVIGIAWLSFSKSEKASIPDLGFGAINKGILFGVLSSVCVGIGLVLSKKGLYHPTSIDGELNPLHASWMRIMMATIAIFALTTSRGKLKLASEKFIRNNNNGSIYLLFATIFGPVIAVAFSLFAIKMIKVSVAQTIFSLIPVFVLPVSYFFYKEKINLRTIVASIISISGVVIVIWRDEIAKFILE
jgi:drug/metabolite transporter (DMT)-like permease